MCKKYEVCHSPYYEWVTAKPIKPIKAPFVSA